MVIVDYLWYVSLIGLFTGVFGTFGGSILVFLVKEMKENLLTFVLGISGGIMTVVVFLDLIPEALELASVFSTLAGMLLGAILIAGLDIFFPHQHFMNKKYNINLKAGILLAVGIAIHNIPEGLAIGAGYSADRSLGLGLAVIIGVQNFPEGMAMATSLSLAGVRNLYIVLATIVSGIPMGLGAFIGAYFGKISDFFLSFSLGFAAGAMLFITFDELIPSAHEKNEGYMAISGILIGVFIGIYLSIRV
ncbi:ZIP family metal transporter [Iocasia frigidifontis]|uniref:ZIP family metal transporter n=1 Tax=Iocasia fonsfrigidae TaxID=2682810 RepID=A0A8A7K5P3_9FIRM|nr:ZIP family metal transporter [Iocasia fonsfrigidae]